MKLFLFCDVQSCFSNKYPILCGVWTHEAWLPFRQTITPVCVFHQLCLCVAAVTKCRH